jgi:hypothetical protein
LDSWKDKENYSDIVEKEFDQIQKYFDENEREMLRKSALNRQNSEGVKKAFGELDLNRDEI